jgi:hypothetical protein
MFAPTENQDCTDNRSQIAPTVNGAIAPTGEANFRIDVPQNVAPT